MKRLLTFAIIFTFSVVLIGCSSGSDSKSTAPANTNSGNTAAKPAAAQPSPQSKQANTGRTDGKSDADRMDGKSDADRSNSNSNR